MKLIQLKPKDILPLKHKLLKKQKYKCKICGIDLSNTESKGIHVDHQHYGDKLIRAVLCRRCNAVEGKMYNSYIRSTKKEQRSEKDYLSMLKGMVGYATIKPTRYIHPKALKRKK